MNMKRWIALGAAALVLFISVAVSSAYAIFQATLSTSFDDMLMATDTELSENIIESGDLNNRIVVLNVDGVIQDTGSASSFFGTAGYDHKLFMEQLEQIRNDDTIKGVVLKVNSPGGGVVESAQIYDKIIEIQEETEKAFYVSMGSMAASGGYYIAAPADKIFVSEETLTGSIGVIMESVNYGELAERYGIDFVTIKSGPYKDILSPSREMTDDERALLQEMLDSSYEAFIDVIEEGRGMSEEQVKTFADGRIMNGRQAVDQGLADDFGYAEDTIAAIKTDLDVENATVFEYGIGDSWGSLFSAKAGSMFGASAEEQAIAKLLADYSAPRMMYIYGEK